MTKLKNIYFSHSCVINTLQIGHLIAWFKVTKEQKTDGVG